MADDTETVRGQDVDRYLARHLLAEDPVQQATLRANESGGLPAIDVSPLQGKLLHLLARISCARRVLEIGTLGGYSTIWLARALDAGGQLVSLEVSEAHAAVARKNIAGAGLAARVEVITGPAAATLERLIAQGERPFDLIFIDADKRNNPVYLKHALSLSRPGTVIVVDNVVRHGAILDETGGDADVAGIQAMFTAVGGERRLTATAIQTVGSKGWDGFLLALVEAA